MNATPWYRHKSTIISAVVAGVLSLAILAAFVIISLLGERDSSDRIAVFGPHGLSVDQEDLVAELGYPDGFTIAFDPVTNIITKRKEVWRYYGVGSVFMFRNGEYAGMASDLPPLMKGAVLPKVRPERFDDSMNVGAIRRQLGAPLADATLNPKLAPDTKVYYFKGGVSATFTAGRLSYMQALPYVPASDSGEDGDR